LLTKGLLLVSGWVLIAAAVAALIRLNIGVAPYAALNVGLGERLGVPPGTAMWLSGLVLVVLAWVLGHRPGPATPVGFVTIGLLVNFLLPFMGFLEEARFKEAIFVAVVTALYQGVCLVIVSGFGAGPVEVLVLALNARWLSLRASSWGVEFACAGVGYLLGGPVNVLTAAFVVLAGPLIAVLLPVTKRVFGGGVVADGAPAK
jgi:uncharacterized membrane protein YczE